MAELTTPFSQANESSSEESSDDSCNLSDEEDVRSRDEILDDFSSEWMVQLDHDDKGSLAIFLCHTFSKHFKMQATEGAQLAAHIVGKNEKTVRRWRTAVIRNKGKLPKTQQGRYVRKGVLWQNEELCKING